MGPWPLISNLLIEPLSVARQEHHFEGPNGTPIRPDRTNIFSVGQIELTILLAGENVSSCCQMSLQGDYQDENKMGSLPAADFLLKENPLPPIASYCSDRGRLLGVTVLIISLFRMNRC